MIFKNLSYFLHRKVSVFKFDRDGLGYILGALWRPLGALWRPLGAFWRPLGAFWRPLGAFFSRLSGHPDVGPFSGNEELALAELDSVLNSVSYHSASSGAKSSSSGKSFSRGQTLEILGATYAGRSMFEKGDKFFQLISNPIL
jgi:hypothetical protein